MKTILVTGAAGFIGFHVSRKLLERGDKVIGIDNLNNYYDVNLKLMRLDVLKKYPEFVFYKEDLAEGISPKAKIDKICHLAAQAGVRYSLEKPLEYERSNILGTLNVFEFARQNGIKDVVYASSSSVYGNCKEKPFREDLKLDEPISLYAATKKANELMAYSYHHLYGLNMTGLRFFTVYGPYGRPDMACFKFADKIINGETIDIYNQGDMKRDFTYVEDIVDGVVSAIDHPFPYEIFNLARSETVNLMEFIKILEEKLGETAKKNFMPLQAGDVYETSGDITKARRMLGYNPKTSIAEGVKNFCDWYKEYRK
jgi:UDP-glucuronate 4-epimerase